jgi:hypothetical protein
MSLSIHCRFREQVRFLRRQFLQDGELPFTDALSESAVAQALKASDVVWLDRIYSPLVTLWVFLGQVLSQDHSCRAAVARLIAHRVSRGQRPCSAETGAYCQARKRLPEEFYAEVARKAGQSLDNSAKKEWLWKGRRVLTYDGSTVSMPDTAENQQAYPQPPQQRLGVGFPLARIAAFFSLSCGTVLDLAICSYSGKGHSELGMLRQLWISCFPEISSSPTGTCVRGTKSICSSGVASTRSLVSIIAAESTSGAASGWARAITLSSGIALVAFARSTGKASNHFPNCSRSARRASRFSSLGFAVEA